jgi:hypothetical protein
MTEEGKATADDGKAFGPGRTGRLVIGAYRFALVVSSRLTTPWSKAFDPEATKAPSTRRGPSRRGLRGGDSLPALGGPSATRRSSRAANRERLRFGIGFLNPAWRGPWVRRCLIGCATTE